ncbi:MAG TPA: AAA family ATPase [Planctomycetota bacterium]|nr:AAA family ATPase [Planctomycetota bacterium]
MSTGGMSWESLVGQQPAKKYLRSVLSARRHAHAYLFSGPSGVGKRTAAAIFAQVLLCHQPPAPDVSCGKCKSCHWFQSRKGLAIEHPDVISLLKFSGSAEKGFSEKPVADQDPIIRLETVQYVCEQLHRSPMSGNRRVVIIPEAQRLCRGQAEPANAFLKTLEEPPESSLIIMTTSQPEALLETIVSRVQFVQFRRLSLDDIRGGLSKQLSNLPQSERDVAALLADGSLGRAKELLEGDLKNWRSAVITGLGKLSSKAGPQFGLMLWALADQEGKRLFAAEINAGKKSEDDSGENDEQEEMSEGEAKTEAGWKRYVFRRLLEVLEVCFRDAMICAAAPDAGAELLLQPDQRQLSQALAAKFGAEGCQRILAALRDSLLAVRLYVRGDVVGRALSGKIVEAMQPAA